MGASERNDLIQRALAERDDADPVVVAAARRLLAAEARLPAGPVEAAVRAALEAMAADSLLAARAAAHADSLAAALLQRRSDLCDPEG